MQWHRNIEIEGIVITDTGDKKHKNYGGIIRPTDHRLYCSPTRSKNVAFHGNE